MNSRDNMNRHTDFRHLSPCLDCVEDVKSLVAERDRYREALEKIASGSGHAIVGSFTNSHVQLCEGKEIAKEALSKAEIK